MSSWSDNDKLLRTFLPVLEETASDVSLTGRNAPMAEWELTEVPRQGRDQKASDWFFIGRECWLMPWLLFCFYNNCGVTSSHGVTRWCQIEVRKGKICLVRHYFMIGYLSFLRLTNKKSVHDPKY